MTWHPMPQRERPMILQNLIQRIGRQAGIGFNSSSVFIFPEIKVNNGY
jgi:hypothetical protein